MNKKMQAWTKRRSDPSVLNDDNYKAICVKVKDALFDEQASAESKIISSGDSGKFFNYINSRINHKTGISPILNSAGEIVFTDTEKAECFSSHFSNIGIIDNNVLPAEWSPRSYSVNSCDSSDSHDGISFDVDCIDNSDVYKCLTKLHVGAAGPDGLAPLLYKKLAVSFVVPLTFIFNLILQSGSVPVDWLSATVVPVFKKGTTANVENYRPISLTNSACKIFETVIKNKLINFLLANHLLSPNQHGFLARHSTCTNLLEAFDDWTKSLDASKETVVVFVDFARAFDSVSIPKLIFKLERLGICGKILSCIKSLLSNRSQRVKVGSSLSMSRPVVSGVPQGSVLGPILFLLFVNDVSYYLPPDAKSKLFADDLKSYISVSDKSNSTNIPLLLEAITDWSLTWQLPLSPGKCSWMLISNRHSPCNFSFSLSGCCLRQLDEVKDLGVMFDSKLLFSNHVCSIVAKAKQRIFLLKRAFVCSDALVLISAFKSYILPILEYCSPVWSPSSVADILKLESVQRSFTKYLPSFSNLSYLERLNKAGLMSLERRRLNADLILLYKIIHKLIDTSLLENIVFETNCTRGNAYKIKHLPARLNTRLNFFVVKTVRIWNSLPDAIVCCDSVNSFKSALANESFSKFLIFM
jgi:hypothetical protein